MADSRVRLGQQPNGNAQIALWVSVAGTSSSVEVDVDPNDTDSDVAKMIQDAWNAESGRPASVSRSGAEMTFTCEGSTPPNYSAQQNGGQACIVPTYPSKHTFPCGLQVWVVP